MMNEAKIGLSPEEAGLAGNAEIILTKNAVMKKLQAMMAELQEPQQELIRQSLFLPEEVRNTSPKISRGENYLGLPWLVLDQPRFFQLHHSFAIRILFWWGRSFIITLHLSGRYKQEFEERIFEKFEAWAAAGYHFCIHEDQWVHHLGEDNYLALEHADRKELSAMNATRTFLKLAKKIELGQINERIELLHDEFRNILELLKR